MIDRRALLEREREILASYAMHSADTRGRDFPEPEHDLRPPFQRDRDRIVHCSAFRRLEYKTQVFVNHEGDYYRTRLTHSIEAAQITRTVARALGLNEDLAEAIALSHDLGHTPFGHAGEKALNRLMAPYGGFEHNAQSLRVVEVLEKRYPEFPGLNLSWEVREGIAKHSSAHDRPVVKRFDPQLQAPLEAQIVDYTDEIAYNTHDVDDGLQSMILTKEDLAQAELWQEAYEGARARYPGADESVLRYQALRRMINRLVTDLVATTQANVEAAGAKSVADIRAAGRRLVGFSPAVEASCRVLKSILMDRLYSHYRVKRMAVKAAKVIEDLFHAYMEEPRQMPTHVQLRIETEADTPQVVADYIAGMTDRFALDEHKKLFDPNEKV